LGFACLRHRFVKMAMRQSVYRRFSFIGASDHGLQQLDRRQTTV
jgi:hypothetical protein